jgi:hypothetical protein
MEGQIRKKQSCYGNRGVPAKPSLSIAALNGMNGITFNGSNKLDTTNVLTSITSPITCTYFVVGLATTTGNTYRTLIESDLGTVFSSLTANQWGIFSVASDQPAESMLNIPRVATIYTNFTVLRSRKPLHRRCW